MRQLNLLLSSILATSFLSACGGGGGSSSSGGGSGTVDRTSPVVTFSIDGTIAARSGESIALSVSATDNIGVSSGPTVSCTNGATYSGGAVQLPTTQTNLTVVCTATARDAAGNTGSDQLTINVTGVDTTAPVITINPTSVTMSSGSTATMTVTASDNVGVTSGPTVSCTNGVTFSNDTLTAPTTTSNITSVCTATASDAAGNTSTNTASVTVTAGSAPSKATLDGTFLYASVPHNTTTNGLDYANTTNKPARGITVQALNSANEVVQSTSTDGNGYYSFSLDPDISYRVLVAAELLKTDLPSWQVRVTDNTATNMPVYAAAGSYAVLPASGQTRNLIAQSGWSSVTRNYSSGRIAAPFAILDPIYEAMTKVSAVDSTVAFPYVEFRWSVKNTNSSGNVTDGNIGTSSYQSTGSSGNVYVLGDADNDTDEYDSHVIVHEWGHYFQDVLSRDNSTGGPHSGGQRLDPRLAFSEGWGNALSGMILDDPIYRDSLGLFQGSGFSNDVESNSTNNRGWFNEASVQSILYDIYDSAADGPDSLATGIGPIYTALRSATFLNSPYLTTIFSFSEAFKAVSPESASGLDQLFAGQLISGTGANGSGETNNGGLASALPVYKDASVNGPAIEVCSVNDNGDYNKLGNRAFVYVNIASAGSYTITVTRKSGATNRDPDFAVFQGDTFFGYAESDSVDTETKAFSLPSGGIVVDVYDYNNVSGSSTKSGDACYDFTITN